MTFTSSASISSARSDTVVRSRAQGIQSRQQIARGRTVGVAEVAQRAQVGANGLAARVERQQDLVGIAGGPADGFALPAHALGDGTQGRIQFRRIDLVQ